MLNNRISDFTDFTGFDHTGFGFDNSGTAGDLFNFDSFNMQNTSGLYLQNHQYAGPSDLDSSWYLRPPEVDGASQPYTGVEVLGGLNGLSHLHNLITAPTTMYPGNQMSPDEGCNPPFNPGMTIPIPTPPPQYTKIPTAISTPSFFPTYTSWLSSTPSTSGARDAGAIGEVVPLHGGLGAGAEIPDPDPFGLFKHNVTARPVSAPVMVAPSCGPQRRRQRGKRERKHNPVKSTKGKDADEGGHGDGWDVALAHFQARLHNIVFDRLAPGGFLPEMALAAKTTKIVKEELKRSPLQGTKAEQGSRPRDTEDFLIGILGEIVPTSTAAQDGLEDIGKKGALFTRLADELESKLVAVNDSSALRPPWVVSCKQTGKGTHPEQTEVRVKKNKRERAKRDGERSQIERMSRLFRVGNPQRTWTRVEVLSFAVLFLFWGPSAFSPGFVREAPASQSSQTENGSERT